MVRRRHRRGTRSRYWALLALLAGGIWARRRRLRAHEPGRDGAEQATAASWGAPAATPPGPTGASRPPAGGPERQAPDEGLPDIVEAPGAREQEPVVTLWEHAPAASRQRETLRILCEYDELTAAALAPLLSSPDGEPADVRGASRALGALRRAEGALLERGTIHRRVLQHERDRSGAGRYRLEGDDRAALRRHLDSD